MKKYLLAFCFIWGACVTAQEQKTLEDLQKIEGFHTLLPKGRIAAIREPVFVSATEAKMPEHAWVIGVTDGTHAKAYSINLLNKHEIVNDFIGDKPIATTW